ncbi:MAG: DUF420 domain-containing protein [Bacteroidetes bacterium]|jgi:putative membrane protein|nr:MAG: DUF420 domain-containing protein [Bacteroidota bacterium]TAE62113.1 MAG: DUF420 domain-containing protein [Bacteroidota bacterium]TAF98295.1 MAG: DUF420 domain-containing protein [Bacteroidota bacterium]
MLQPLLRKNDGTAKWLIGIFSAIVFVVVVVLGRVKLNVQVGFDVHIFALINAVINGTIAVLLLAALLAVKQKSYQVHRALMLAALGLSVLFLVSYIAHHLLAGEVKYGDYDHNGVLSVEEKAEAGVFRYAYYFILITHIILATLILPIILFTAYRGLTGEYAAHKKLSRITWPIWFYVAITGPLVYFLVSPFYT